MKIQTLCLFASFCFINLTYAANRLKNINTLDGTISAFESGDNFYLTIIDTKGKEHIALCAAPFCEKLITATDNTLGGLKGKKVRVTIDQGNQVDGSGRVMATMDAFVNIQLLKPK